MSRGRLKPEDEDKIQKNYELLKYELEASDLLDYLFLKDVITFEDKIRISNGKTRSERNEDLLRTILLSGPGTSFSFFLSSLQEKYHHIRKRLERQDSRPLPGPPKDYGLESSISEGTGPSRSPPKDSLQWLFPPEDSRPLPGPPKLSTDDINISADYVRRQGRLEDYGLESSISEEDKLLNTNAERERLSEKNRE